jgi:hypothetical protein
MGHCSAAILGRTGLPFSTVIHPASETVIPAKAGIHFSTASSADRWIPAFAGMTFSFWIGHRSKQQPLFASETAGCPPPDATPHLERCAGPVTWHDS